MEVDDVARADEAGVIEIAHLKIEGIKGPQGPAAAMPGVAADHIELQSHAGLQRGVFQRVAARGADRPGQNVALSETTDLDDRLYVVVETIRFAEQPRAEGLSLLSPSTHGIAGVIVLEPQVIEIRFEGQRRAERGRRAIDTPEELAGELIIELVLLFAGGLSHERIDLPPPSAADQLQTVELERDIRRGPCRHQPPGSVAHRE